MHEFAGRLVDFLAAYGGLGIYVIVLVAAVIENLFPPAPGDTVLFAGAVVAAKGGGLWPVVLMAAVAGNIAGAMLVYWFGLARGRRYFQNHRGRFVDPERLRQIERWFDRYGARVILLSRFLTGIRSGVALWAGLGEVPALRMAAYTAVSTLLWNSLIVAAALALNYNWAAIYEFARIYNGVVFLLFGVIAVAWAIHALWRWRKAGGRG